MIYKTEYLSPAGRIVITSDGKTITSLCFDEKSTAAALKKQNSANVENTGIFDTCKKWLDIYFTGKDPDFTPPVNATGTPFQKAVWDILLTIPFGQTMTYGEIAEILAMMQGKKKISAQAVGGAVGHNPVAVIIPCHRVVGVGNTLTGYAGGLDKKIKLLSNEGHDISKFSI